jgi:hypothetical protein
METNEQKNVEKLVLLTTQRVFDDSIGTKVLQVELSGAWVEVDEDIFISWTGLRRINGEDYHGPVYNFNSGSETPYAGSRTCKCGVCQEHVEPSLKAN